MDHGNRKLVEDVTVVFLSARARNEQIQILSEETQLEGTWHPRTAGMTYSLTCCIFYFSQQSFGLLHRIFLVSSK